MNDIEDILRANKARIDQLEVPDELEARLRDALTRKHASSFKGRVRIYVAAMIVTLVMLTSNYDVIAFYGKQLLGYEQIMNGTLQQLNELGKGQTIGKSHTFNNGVSLTLDYVMLDENQFLLFYTIKDPSGFVEDYDLLSYMSVKGFWGEYRHSSSEGKINVDKTQIKYISSFAPPFPFERNLSFRFGLYEQGKLESGQIDFSLNRNTAMGHSLKSNLNQLIQVDETEIMIDSILASPTKTVIKGSFQSIFGLVKDHLSGERFRPSSFEIKLIANGNEIAVQGGGMTTDLKGMKFNSDFDALPLDLKQLQIELVSFGADHDVNENFKLKTTQRNQVLEISNQRVEVHEISQTKAETLITVSSEESLIITKLYLMIDGVKVSLEETINDNYDKLIDGSIIHKRTLRFLGAGENLELFVQRMTYAKNYNKIIDVRVK
ncbi:DUF4179 domain-containing protein [Desulfosporosinus fructosivorans]|uniref:DUF4179 domain-containing protein n=1 Tax=Desulfosporosinus fructosivorans TaxID=2018669 RepID=A0A4Z0QY40_9FIRM|nr:DUF4179 domain-containing protein [Desulfosporosinus fructosivorans]TGE35209.1 DUF4179 domain-containing protein [Desulfosporosinus fructosivorans]